ncbi:endolytic transglycosylase MltG [Eubacterium multiforme]|uniref:Endolytic murein transglycosylase n=1 Tax=Eubacterium multiforme TaxID=83339 RepID=A0ABT9UN74_9FIRM|nr:endolytic transglycosylase MltG [Eubacterium multiforme]MDQ0148102.1 UPF0755 protein [Eubacterium multiforme]
MRNFKKKFLGLCIVLIIILGGTIFMYSRTVNHPLKSNEESIEVQVNQGEGFYTLLSELKAKNLIKNEFFIKLYIKLNNVVPKIESGTYTVKTDVTLSEFLKTLETKDVTNVVIPEGYTVVQIADVLQKDGLFSKEEFLKAVKNYKLPSYIKESNKRKYPLEGFLFPDTYSFEKGVTPDKVIKTMLDKFQETMKQVQTETGVTIPNSEIDEIVTKASLIEKEARTEADRPLISSVIDNRLKKGMPLQIDATVIYALGTHVDQVLYKHLKIDSPYNTYKFKGLPVGPIANPGKPSLIAAVKPAKTNYLYYLLIPNSDEHKFTASGAEFNKLREEYGYNK